MFVLKTLGTAVILALAAGCQTAGSKAPSSGPTWAAHEEISRTYDTLCTVHEHKSGSALDLEDTSRTYDACCPMIADDPDLRPVGDDTSRTYHSACRAFADPDGSRGEDPAALGSGAKCEWAERSEDCAKCNPK